MFMQPLWAGLGLNVLSFWQVAAGFLPQLQPWAYSWVYWWVYSWVYEWRASCRAAEGINVMNCVFKMMNFAFKMMNFEDAEPGGAAICVHEEGPRRQRGALPGRGRRGGR